MLLHDFFFDLPPELIAQAPLAERSASRLLVLDRRGEPVGAALRDAPLGDESLPDKPLADESLPDKPLADAPLRDAPLRDLTMRDLPQLLAPGDLLVLNDTRVIAARLMGTKPTGGRVEIFLERVLGEDRALVQMRASKAIRAGLTVRTAAGEVSVLEQHGDLWEVRTPGPALAFFEQYGEVPLPPYIQRLAEPGDKERYQSIFARDPGAVAAPTASLHFDAALAAALEARGIERAFVTLHVGAGTFQPVRAQDLTQHVLHEERVIVGEEVCEAIARTRQRGGRVIAVGTTVVRALEAAALRAAPHSRGQAGDRATGDTGGASSASSASSAGATLGGPMRERAVPAPWSGETRLFIRPGFEFQVIDGLLTNFHLPESTLLMLVCAFAGRERVLAAYEHAVRLRYRFFSYGDAMLVTPSP